MSDGKRSGDPTGLVKVSKCEKSYQINAYKFNKNDDSWASTSKHPLTCDCHGTGFIRTDLTTEQAVEWAKWLIKDWMPHTEFDFPTMPDGSRIELKEEK